MTEAEHFERAMGRALFARLIDLKRTANGLPPAGDGILGSLWNRQTENDRKAWDALWVGCVTNGWNGRFGPEEGTG